MSTPTDAHQYLVTANGLTFIYHSATPLTDEELAEVVAELDEEAEA